MRVDLNYGSLVNKQFVLDWWKKNGRGNSTKAISELAAATMVPCINIAFWLGEVEGWPDSIKRDVDSLIEFYDYKEIRNKPPGCPW